MTEIEYQNIADSIMKGTPIHFTSSREDLKFQNVESDFKSINFDYPFPLANMYLQNAKEFLATATVYGVELTYIDRIRLLSNHYGATMIYHKIGSGDYWNVYIQFR